MITLITGAPGSGKTLYCIDKLLRPLIGTSVSGTDQNGAAVAHDRVIYSNINGLLLDHEFIDADWLEKLPQNKTTGAVVVFDEVQRVWPNRPTGSKKPPAVEYLETHRHDGIDVILLTQNPQLLDPAVRALVGRHLHMRRAGSLAGAVVYEWDACSNALNFKSAFRKTPYRYSREVYKLYTSAKIHTKQKRSLPFALWLALAGVAAAAVLWPRFFSTLEGKAHPKVLASAAGASAPLAAASAVSATANGQPVLTPLQYYESLRPRLAGLPYTAARYDGVTQPRRAPLPAACISSKSKGCRCFSQDGTSMYVPETTCKQIVDGGFFVDFEPSGQMGGAMAGGVVSPNAVRWTGAREAGGHAAAPAVVPDAAPSVAVLSVSGREQTAFRSGDKPGAPSDRIGNVPAGLGAGVSGAQHPDVHASSTRAPSIGAASDGAAGAPGS